MAASSAIYSNTFALPTAPTAVSRSQQSFRSAIQQPWEHREHLQPPADSPPFIGANVSGFVISAVVAMGSAVRHRKRKQKTSTLRFAAKVVATAPVAKKVEGATTDKTERQPIRRQLRPVLSDPEAPKRPAPAFVRYLQDFQKGPEAKGTHRDTMIAAGAKWKKLSPDKRVKWQEPHDKEMKKYEQERQKYVNCGKRDAWYRDPAKPKRPLSGYYHFLLEQRKKYSHLPLTEQTKKLGQEWTALKSSKKSTYEEIGAKDKQAYIVAIKTYKASGKEDEWLAKVGITAVREKAEAKRMKLKEAEKKKATDQKARIKKKEVAATIKEKAAKAKAKMVEKKTKAIVAQKQLREKHQVKQKLLLEKVKAGKAKKAATEKKAKELQKAKLVAAKLKEKAATAKPKAKGADKKTATVASVTKKVAKDKAEVAPKKKLAVSTQKDSGKATAAKVEEGLKKKVVAAKLKAETLKAKAKTTTAVKV